MKLARPGGAREPWPRPRLDPRPWAREHLRVARESLHFLSDRLATTLLVWLLVGIALALPAGLFLLQANLGAMTSGWEGRPGISVYFDLGASTETLQTLAALLDARDEVEDVAIITAEQALAEFQRHAQLADALELLDTNPLPASLRAKLRLGADPAALAALAVALEKETGVAEVVVEKTWLERVSELNRVVRRLGGLLGVLFGLGALLVTATSVRLAIETRLEELRVLKLVGATSAQLRRPLLYLGTSYGFGGAVMAAMLISLGLALIEGPLARLAGSYGHGLDIAAFDATFLLTLLGTGAALGLSGALLAARQRLSRLAVV